MVCEEAKGTMLGIYSSHSFCCLRCSHEERSIMISWYSLVEDLCRTVADRIGYIYISMAKKMAQVKQPFNNWA
jgi:hypothetical protein